MNDLVPTNNTQRSTILTRYGQEPKKFASIDTPSEPALKPPGTYVCMECGDTRITWRTPVDEYKTKCPKCGVQMTRVSKSLSL